MLFFFFFYVNICIYFCVLDLISGKIEVEHVISKKLQLKRKAEVSTSVTRVKLVLNLDALALRLYLGKCDPRIPLSVITILCFVLLINLFSSVNGLILGKHVCLMTHLTRQCFEKLFKTKPLLQ